MKTRIRGSKIKPIILRLTEDEYEIAKNRANAYTSGNVTAWIRYSCQLEPLDEDLIDEKEFENDEP